jgi:hypothetical protein
MSEVTEWVPVGQVEIESGVVVVGDPDYLPQEPTDAVLAGSETLQGVRELAHGVFAVGTGYGDGVYPVEVRYQDDRVAEVRVRFIFGEVTGA